MVSPGPVFWAGHAAFVRHPAETSTYAVTFSAFFEHDAFATDPAAPLTALLVVTDDEDAGAPAGEDPREGEAPVRLARHSSSETLRKKDFARCSESEIEEVYRLMASMRHHGSTRQTRRRVSIDRPRGAPDLRRTVSRSLRSSGELAHLYRLGPGRRDRPLILLVDVSGSMEPYARAFLQFAHAAVAGRRRVEAFTLGTRLTRITRELAWRDPDAAIRRAAESVPDMSGGTRLGEGIARFNDRFGVAGMARGAVVVILSDGWDRGDPEQIAGEMARLGRVAHRIIWVNPLKATPGYEPLARGMAAALPHVDAFLEGHSLASLENLVDVIALGAPPVAGSSRVGTEMLLPSRTL